MAEETSSWDKGGSMLSFPSSWYNKKNGWMKRNFGDSLVYFVAVVAQSDNPAIYQKPMHTIQILGDNESAPWALPCSCDQ